MRQTPSGSTGPARDGPAAQATRVAPASDEQLMLDYGRGSLAAFEELYRRHEGPVYRYLLRSVRIQAVADELLQDVFLQLVHAAARYEVQAKFTTWLYRIARNRLIDHLRAVEPETLHALQDAGEDGEDPLARLPADEAVQPERQALDRARAREFVNAVHDLPAPQREAFLLHAQSGLSLEQVAELCGSSRETVKSRFRYACAKLRNTMAHWSES
jgi:RNA polymerase sigma-70 factor (ECF subfamily)